VHAPDSSLPEVTEGARGAPTSDAAGTSKTVPTGRGRALLLTLRPKQWVKNLFVLAPLVFSKNLLNTGQLARALAGALLFCLLSGAVYLINDVLDIEKDRAHPRKCLRPIPSGQLPIRTAKLAAVALCAMALGGGLFLGPAFATVALAYFALNLAYSLQLKHQAFLDVLSIATGFLLRVIAGAFAIRVPASPWLLVCTGLLACFLGFGKRAHELQSSGGRAEQQRAVLARYRIEHLRFALRALALLTILAYFTYTQSQHTVSEFDTRAMAFTTPFIGVGVIRFLRLVDGRPRAESPTEEMLRDPVFLVNLALWVASVTFIIYFAR
jgi:4-hydroxybenzoate polyprenyltransferase